MNAYVQEWIWRFSRANGIPKFIFLAIGRRFKRTKAGEYITDPLPVEELVQVTGLSQATVRRAIQELEGESGEIVTLRSARRGTVNRYQLRRSLKLPLNEADTPHQRSRRAMAALTGSDGEHPAPSLTQNDESPPASSLSLSDHIARREHPRSSLRALARVAASDGVLSADSSSEVVRTEVLGTTAEEPALAAFFEWFLQHFRTHRGVPPPRMNRGRCLSKLRDELLGGGYAVESWRPMAIRMWAEAQDSFIATSDYSIHVLCARASWLLGRIDRRVGSDSASIDESWAKACELLRVHFDAETFDRWIAPLEPTSDWSGTLTICAPSRAHREAMPDDVETWIRYALRQARPSAYKVQFSWPPSQEATA